MDQLAIDAKAASNLGMSYGHYIAIYKPPVPPAERNPKKKTAPPAKETERKRCVICGGEIIPGSRRTKTCSPNCADALRQQQNREAQERHRQKKLSSEDLDDTAGPGR